MLNMSGHLIKIDIEEILQNKNIQGNLSTETLLLIGSIYGRHQNNLKQYQLKTIDLINETVSLENLEEKIIIKIDELLNDHDLLSLVSQIDLTKILTPYVFHKGYKACAIIADEDESSGHKQEKSNIVKLELVN